MLVIEGRVTSDSTVGVVLLVVFVLISVGNGSNTMYGQVSPCADSSARYGVICFGLDYSLSMCAVEDGYSSKR